MGSWKAHNSFKHNFTIKPKSSKSSWKFFNPTLQLFLCPVKYELSKHMTLILTMNHVWLPCSRSHKHFNVLLHWCAELLNTHSDFQISLYLLHILTGLVSIRLASTGSVIHSNTRGILLGDKKPMLRHAWFQSNSWHN